MKENDYILILSDEDDITTDDVIDWLDYKEVKYLRLNGTNELVFDNLSIQKNGSYNYILREHKHEVNFDEIRSYWYRRGKLNLKMNLIQDLPDKKLRDVCNSSIYREYFDLLNFFYQTLEKKHGIGSIYENSTNKLQNLLLASNVGLAVPETVILTKKSNLIKFFKEHKKVLTKPIGQAGLVYKDEEKMTEGISALINIKDIENIPNTFPLSLFQGYIEKAYELRIFYLNGKCFSSAIFSQRDKKTKIDFRNYNFMKPNRVSVYKLPETIENKIIQFMKTLGMDSGSLDMIVTPKKEFYFLEVNPVGQFFQVSYPCNYYLEKIIANYLSKPLINEN